MPSSLADYAATILAFATLLGGVWAYLSQRAALAEEREKRKALEESTARKDEFEHQQALIETLQRAMESQNMRHERERAEWHNERAAMQSHIRGLQNEIDELRGRKHRNTGPLGA